MFNMRTMRIWSAAAVIALVLALGFILSVPRAHDVGSVATSAATPPPPFVSVRDSFKKGTHTIKVSVAAPDACTNVTGDASTKPGASAADPATILIALVMPKDEGICLEEPATTTLSFSVAAGADAAIVTTINGGDAAAAAGN